MGKRKQNQEPEKPTKKPSKSLKETRYSLCVPSSIISDVNAYNLEQITYVAYQIAKTATAYDVAEIVILDIPSAADKAEELEKKNNKQVQIGGDKGGKKIKFNISDEEIVQAEKQEKEEPKEYLESQNHNNALLFASLLQFFITPPYLVKSVFASSNYKSKLKYAQKLPKLSTLPFMNNNEVNKDFKEGFTIAKESPKTKSKKKLAVTKYVNIGESQPLELTQDIPVNVRVTVDVKNKKVVSPLEAYGTIGNRSSFGYFVRIANSFSSIFTQSACPDGYAASVYIEADTYFTKPKVDIKAFDVSSQNGQILLVASSMRDLEYSFAKDKLEGVEKVEQMFDGKLDIPVSVRIEDASLIALAKMN